MAVARALRVHRSTSTRQYAVAARTVLGFSGAFLSVAGITLSFGGLMSAFEGSAFYTVAGMGLAVSGALLAKRNRAGAWTYLAVFAGTVSWSLHNIDQGSSLPYRLIGPVLLLAILALLVPVLAGWRPRRAAIAFCAIALVTVGIGVSSTAGGPLAHQTAAITQFIDSEVKGVLQ